MGDTQPYQGYTLFLCRKHVSELHELEPDFKMQFLQEMSQVAEAVYRAFKPKKLNYELLGNVHAHLHWHLFPRYEYDPDPKAPVWYIDWKRVMCEKPSDDELKKAKRILLRELTQILNR